MPDIITVAKGIASGMPVSAVVADKAIMDKWAPGAHGGTYGGNAVGTAAAYATLQVMKDERLPENAAAMGELLMDGLREIQADHPVIGEVRGLGLMHRRRVRQAGRRAESRRGRAGHPALPGGARAAAQLRHLGPGDPDHPAAGRQRGPDRGSSSTIFEPGCGIDLAPSR